MAENTTDSTARVSRRYPTEKALIPPIHTVDIHNLKPGTHGGGEMNIPRLVSSAEGVQPGRNPLLPCPHTHTPPPSFEAVIHCKSEPQAAIRRMQSTLHATRPTPHMSLRVWCNRRLPGRGKPNEPRPGIVGMPGLIIIRTTAMHDVSTTHPPFCNQLTLVPSLALPLPSHLHPPSILSILDTQNSMTL